MTSIEGVQVTKCPFFKKMCPNTKFIPGKKAATIFKIRLSLKEKAEGLSTCPRCENAAGGLRDIYFYSI